MKLDKGATIAEPRVGTEAAKAIWPVALEVVIATALLGWAMLSMNPNSTVHLWGSDYSVREALNFRSEDMLRFIGEYFASARFGPAVGQMFGWIIGIVFFLLLLSAANTAIVAMIGLLYMMTRDHEMPPQFMALNRHGVPQIPLFIAVGLPIIVIITTRNFTALAGLYAIGVVGAITVNLGSYCFNRVLPIRMYHRILFGITFAALFLVDIKLASTKPDALFFVLCVLGLGLAVRAWTLKRRGLTTVMVPQQVARMVTHDLAITMQSRLQEGQKIMVAARGITPVLSFALDEAQLRPATLCALSVNQIAVYCASGPRAPGRARWRADPD